VFECLFQTDICAKSDQGECFKVNVGDILASSDGLTNITMYADHLRYVYTEGQYFDVGVNEYVRIPGKDASAMMFMNLFCSCVQNKTESRLKCATPGTCFKIVNNKK
jgi:hypothetical protein